MFEKRSSHSKRSPSRSPRWGNAWPIRSIYLASDHLGKGLGTSLYQSLIDELRRLALHTAIGGIALPNAGSVALHEKLGFRKVAHFAEVGFRFGKWIDVAYWQLSL